MPAEQINVVAEQRFQTVAFHAANHRRFTFPEIAVVNDDSVSLLAHRFVNQRLACRHARDDFADFFAPFDLQTVWRVIANCGAVKFFVYQA